MGGRSRSCGRGRGGRAGERGCREFGGEAGLGSPCIWIEGCPGDLAEREVERVCSKFGAVREVSIMTSACGTVALVRFGRLSHAHDAVYALDRTAPFGTGPISVELACNGRAGEADRGGRNVGCGWGRRSVGRSRRRDGRGRSCAGGGRGQWQGRRPQTPPRAAPPKRMRVYLSQLPRDMEEDEFQEVVAEYGRVLQWELHREGSYKCGWAEYGNKSEAEAALAELDDRRMDDWDMRLQAYMYPAGGV